MFSGILAIHLMKCFTSFECFNFYHKIIKDVETQCICGFQQKETIESSKILNRHLIWKFSYLVFSDRIIEMFYHISKYFTPLTNRLYFVIHCKEILISIINDICILTIQELKSAQLRFVNQASTFLLQSNLSAKICHCDFSAH